VAVRIGVGGGGGMVVRLVVWKNLLKNLLLSYFPRTSKRVCSRKGNNEKQKEQVVRSCMYEKASLYRYCVFWMFSLSRLHVKLSLFNAICMERDEKAKERKQHRILRGSNVNQKSIVQERVCAFLFHPNSGRENPERRLELISLSVESERTLGWHAGHDSNLLHPTGSVTWTQYLFNTSVKLRTIFSLII